MFLMVHLVCMASEAMLLCGVVHVMASHNVVWHFQCLLVFVIIYFILFCCRLPFVGCLFTSQGQIFCKVFRLEKLDVCFC